jgi:lipopolysaccharide export system protein LptA
MGYNNSIYSQIVKTGSITAEPSQQDSVKSKLIMSSDKAIYNYLPDGQEVDTLSGHVVLIQDSIYMSCNHAVVTDQINAFATGDVLIIQNDSIYIYADTLRYDGFTKVAILTGEVILDSKSKSLSTTKLIYDATTKIAVFSKGGTLIDDSSKLISREGIYNVDTEEATFKYNVQYRDSSRIIITDSLIYDYARQQIMIISPTQINNNDTEIYCEEGLYSTKNNQGVLSRNVQVLTDGRIITAGILEYKGNESLYKLYINPLIDDDGTIAKGDTIIYNSDTDQLELLSNASYTSKTQLIESDNILYDNKTKQYITKGRSKVLEGSTKMQANDIMKAETGETYATGSVMLYDTSSHSTIYCDQIRRIDSLDISYAYNIAGQPLLIYEMGDGDSLLLRSDTLVSFKIDSLDYFSAYNKVSLVMGDIAGICDSLAYSSKDSIFLMLGVPYLWSDSIQLSADTIRILLSNNQVENIQLKEKALIVDESGAERYNQINGALIDCAIDKGAMNTAFVDGSAQLIYFIMENDSTVKAVNTTLSSKMLFFFKDNEIDQIKFIKKPESVANEYYDGMDMSQYLLEGFIWNIDNRPLLSSFQLLKL